MISYPHSLEESSLMTKIERLEILFLTQNRPGTEGSVKFNIKRDFFFGCDT